MATWAKTYLVEIVAILVAVALLVIAWTPPAKGGEPPFVVTVAVPSPVFTVTVVRPAPPETVRWQWWDAYGNTWFTDEPAPPKPMPAPEAPRPFAPRPATTPATPAPSAVVPSTSWSGSTLMGLTRTVAPWGMSGDTNCTPLG